MQKAATAFRPSADKACLFPAVSDRHAGHGLPLFDRSGQSIVPGQTDRRGKTPRHFPCASVLRSARASSRKECVTVPGNRALSIHAFKANKHFRLLTLPLLVSPRAGHRRKEHPRPRARRHKRRPLRRPFHDCSCAGPEGSPAKQRPSVRSSNQHRP
jgi:hypothetical protein